MKYAIFIVLFGATALAADAAQAAPDVPAWLVTLMSIGQSLPLIGPILIKVMQYLGLIASLTTTTCAFVLAIVKLLQSVSNLAGLGKLADWVNSFENGKIIFYLKYVSIFNAQKKLE